MRTAAVDFGNTRAKLGLFSKHELVEAHRGLSTEELHQYLTGFAPEKLIICSVRHTEQELRPWFAAFPQAIYLNRQTPVPITNAYGTPDTLGYDRLAAAVGAAGLFPAANCLLIDLGTAIKYDLVTADGAFQGGIISPGMNIRFQALHTFTKKLPLLEATAIPPLVGTSTAACIQSGVVNGISAELNGFIERYVAEYPQLQVILSGGDAPFFESQIKYPKFAAPHVVLLGLNRILRHNVEKNLGH